MTRPLFWSLILLSASAIGPAAYAQQTQDAAPTPANTPTAVAPAAAPPASATSAPTASPAPRDISNLPTVSATTLKKARDAGYRMKVRHNAVVFCKKVTETGTRFTTDVCMDENQLAQVLMREQAQRDEMANRSTCTGCSGK
ncbi:MAG TPA: hypothetical protein VIY54_07910 [Steroidobacteraceae bacterium]